MSGLRRDQRPLYPNSPYTQIQDAKQTKAVVLDGGLDYVAARSMVGPGKLLDNLNYEVVDRTGYKRADGLLRWDGGADIDSEDIYYLKSTNVGTTISSPTLGSYLYSTNLQSELVPGDGAPFKHAFGVLMGYKVVSGLEKYVFYARINPAYEPRNGNTIKAINVANANLNFVSSTAPGLASTLSVFDTTNYTAKFTSEAVYSARNMAGYWSDFFANSYTELQNGPRAFVRAGDNAVTQAYEGLAIPGLCYHNDRLYSIVDLPYIRVATLGAEVFVGDIVHTTDFGLLQVLHIETEDGAAWASAGWAHLHYKNVNPTSDHAETLDDFRYKYFNNGSSSVGNAVTILRTGTSAGNTASPTNFLISEPPAIAGLHRSFTEDQAWSAGRVDSITIDSGGSGYNSSPVVSITGGGGYGAQAVARISGGSVVEIGMLAHGFGYTTVPTVTITAASGDAGVVAATGTAVLADFRHAGCRFVDTGWQVDFTGGTSSSGFFAKLDRRKGPLAQSLTFSSADAPDDGVAEASPAGRPFFGSVIAPGGGDNTAPFSWFTSASTAGTIDVTKAHGAAAGSTDYLWTPVKDHVINLSYNSPWITFGAFKDVLNSIPTGSIIKGFRLVLSYEWNKASSPVFPAAGGLPRFSLSTQLVKLTPHLTIPGETVATSLGPVKETALSTAYTAAIDSSVTIGSATDMWGIVGQTVNDLTKDGADLGLSLKLNVQRLNTSIAVDSEFRIDDVLLVIDYDSPSVTYYFSDSVTNTARNVIAADLVSYTIQSGSLVGNDAVGLLQLANLRYVELYDTTPRWSIGAAGTWKMYQSYPGSGSDFGTTAHLATVSGAMRYNGLDSRKDLVDNNSRYEIITANFYEDESYEGIYGVSGAGRAFYFDGTFFSRIIAVPLAESGSATKDKPRHIANHRFYLALGYKEGAVLFSQLGKPEEFNYSLGAGKVGIGDRITGIYSLPGDYLGVFCENSIWGIVGGSVPTFSRKCISPYSGAIEYSIVSLGENPMFANAKGIYNLAQIQEYGDFAGIPLSYSVTPKLLQRLNRSGSLYSGRAATGIVAAYAVRSKNQYRLCFRDGYQLVMSMVGPEREPQFTWLRPLMPSIAASVFEPAAATTAIPIVPLGLTSSVDAKGRERIFLAPDLKQSTDTNNTLTKTAFASYILAVDKFWGFDSGSTILAQPAYFVTNYFYDENPVYNFTLMKVLAEGASRGVADLSVSAAKDYEETTFNTAQDLVLANPAYTSLGVDYYAHSDTASPAQSGRNVLIKFANYNSLNRNTDETTYNITKIPQPPHYVQLLLVDYEEGRRNA